MPFKRIFVPLMLSLFCSYTAVYSQQCTTLGQTPATAFPVCATTVFTQNTVPICSTNDLFVPGCSGTGGALYQNKNPFWYKFTCYASGTLAFVITPLAANEDYDWQLYDITGKNPNDIFTDNSLVVTGNWSATYGATGTSATGVNFIQCASQPQENKPTFAKMPNLIVGHEYILLVSHFTDGQSGYTLAFNGGSAVITDPKIPNMATVKTDCSGAQLTLKLDKKVICNTLTGTGSEFSILPAVANVTAAISTNCTTGFDMDEITITLNNPLPDGNYKLVINNGSDGNRLLDNCGNSIPAGQTVDFQFAMPQPVLADSIGRVGCAPNQLKVYFPKKIACNTIAANGSDFQVTGGGQPVTVIGASATCTNNKSDVVIVQFASPIVWKGNYTLTLKAGNDGNILIDECGIQMPQQNLPFTAADTVSAQFTYTMDMGCRTDTLHFLHDGAHDVNKWNWLFNDNITATTPAHSMVFPASSSNKVRLIVTNGVCTDTVENTIVLDNEVIAGFSMPDVICPEDPLTVINEAKGLIDTWRWNFDVIATSNIKDPTPVQFPQNNKESFYTIKQVVTNNALGCSDSARKVLRVLNNCFIAVPSAFTPNGDGKNDYLYPNNAIKAENLRFNVYNRWGQLVFSSRNWQDKWNGKIGGIEQGSGVYVWMLEYTHRDTKQKIFQKGTTTLIR
jgi:gliding motility-associated-like protein